MLETLLYANKRIHTTIRIHKRNSARPTLHDTYHIL